MFLSFAVNAQSLPAAPTGLTAAPLDGQAALNWADPSDATITGYSVRHATSTTALASSTWAAISNSASSTVAHTVRSLANGMRYYFQIRATNAGGDSAPSNIATTQLADMPSAAVTISDSNLRTALADATGKSGGDVITQLDMATLAGALEMRSYRISVATGLERAVNVTSLDLHGNSISNVTALGSLTSLTYLDLSGNLISNVTALGGLTSLTTLWLADNMIRDVMPLGSLTSLKGLDLANNSIMDVTALGSLTSLTGLDLAGNSISNATALGGLTSLTTLWLADNMIRDVMPLGSLTSLTGLDLAGNSIMDVTALGSLTSLTALYLNRNSISNVTALGHLTSLTELDLSRNSISNVAALGGLTSLTTLWLSSNMIADVAPLVSNAGLGSGDTLYLRGNPLSAASVNTHIPALQGRGVTVEFAVPPAAPAGLTAAPLDAQVALTWTDPSDATVDGYSVRHATSTAALASSTWAAISNSASSTVEHAVRNLANGMRYYFQIRATNAGGDSAPSNTATVQLADMPSAAVTISDEDLRTRLEGATGKSSGDVINQLDMAKLVGTLNLASPDPALRVGVGISVATGLERAVNVTRLELGFNSISDVSPLGGLTSLTYLDLNRNSIMDASPLGSLTSLTYLDLNRNSIMDASPLGSLTSLTYLDLNRNSIMDVSPLRSLTSLEYLDVYGNSISDVSPLGVLTSLIALDLSSNSIMEVTALGGLTSLTALYLNRNSISDVSPLGGLTSLVALYLNRNSTSDVSPLGSLTSLTYLDLNRNSIMDVSPLRSLTSLTTLDLNRNLISNVSPLGSLTSLTYLDLSGNSISNVTALGGLASLTTLYLDRNSISNVSPLGGLTSLTTLNLNRNLISDVTPLVSNAGLGSGDTIRLRGNPLSAASVNMHVPAIADRGAMVDFDARPTSVPFAPSSLAATAAASGVSLRWTDPLDAYVERYELRSMTALASSAWTAITGSNSRTTGHVVPVADDVYVAFELRAVNFNGAGAAASAAVPSLRVDPVMLTVNESGMATYTVWLNRAPAGTVALMVGVADDGIAASPSSLSFTTSTWSVTQTVTVRAAADADATDETATLTHATTGARDYAGLPGWARPSVAVMVDDADTQGIQIDTDPTTPADIDGGALAVTENSSNRYTVRLATAPTGPVTVTATSDHLTLVVDNDTSPLERTLTFSTSTWDTAQTMTARALDDADGGDETAIIAHVAMGGDYGGVSVDLSATTTDDDLRGVTLSGSTLAVPEGSSATYTVRLDTQPVGGTVTVTVGGAGSGISARPTSLTFTGATWNTPRTVRVSAAEDDNPTHESVDLTHSVAGADYGREGVSAGSVRATATDNDTPSLRVVPTVLALVEEGASGVYAVRLNTPPSGDVTVTVGGATASVSADADGATPGAQTAMTFTTTDWATAQTVTVGAPADDDATNATTTLTHAVSGPGDYLALAPAARPGVQVTVNDDDTPGIVIDADPTTLNIADPGPLALHEQSGHAANAKQYTVRLATEPTHAVRVSIESGDRAVSVDGDATPRTRTLTFSTSTWRTAQTVTARAAEDDDASAENVTIAHTASAGDYGGVSANLTATTVDDDTPALLLATSTLAASGVAEGSTATYTVRLATEPSGTVTVTATATATATARVEVDMDGGQAGLQPSLRFDAANWSVPRTATVRGLADDDAADGAATLRHSASGADYGGVEAADETFAVTDDDMPAVLPSATALTVNEGSTAAYTVRLATRPVGGAVTVAATSANASTATVAPPQLRFGAGDWDAPKTFRVHGAQAGSATISHSASGADYGGAATTTVAATVRGTQAAGVRIEPPTLTLREGESGAYRVRLNTQPMAGVTVTATSGSTELAVDADATPQTKQLTFTMENWDREQTVTATALSDDSVDDETATVTHAVTGYAGVASAPSLVVAVRDDDAPGLLFEPAEGLQLEESGAAGTYAARLRFAPSAPVAVAVSSDDAGVAVDTDGGTPLDQDTLTFNATNWSTAQTVMVRAVPDADAASETATLLHAASGAGSGYEGVTATYAVRVSDAEAAQAPTGVAASAAGPTSLVVRWTPSPGAEEHVVQWRRAGQAWSASRQLMLAGGAGSARIDGLDTGAEYEVRVLGLNRGDPGDASTPAQATPRALGPVNRAPVALASFADRTLILGAAQVLDLSGVFLDPDGDALEYAAVSLNPSVVEAAASGAELALRAVGVGATTVRVWATDPGGLVGSLTLETRVVRRASLSADDAQAPEGGAAQLPVRLSPARSTSTRIVWSLALDADAATADADDLVETSGEATIPAGETRIEIAVAIADDDDIEPAREWFEVSLSAPDGCCGPAARARVTVLEGVCDHTPAVRDALRGSDSCTAPTPAMLAVVERLELSGAGAGSLRAGDFAGLSGLRTLLLDGNGLETLPDGLFAGLDSLGELSLQGNPGAPFALAVELARTDADAWAPGPATVQAQFALGGPFALRSELSAHPTAAGLPETVEIDAGATFGAPFAVASTSTLRLVAGPAPLPTTRCGEAPCFRGVEAASGEALTLYRRPPQAQPTPTPEPLRDGDDLRLALGSLIRPGDGDPANLRWRASSSDESVATARVVGGRLVVTPAPGGEGAARIVLEVVDGEPGLSATLRFDVQVEFHWPARQASGWRAGALMEAARAASLPAP